MLADPVFISNIDILFTVKLTDTKCRTYQEHYITSLLHALKILM